MEVEVQVTCDIENKYAKVLMSMEKYGKFRQKYWEKKKTVFDCKIILKLYNLFLRKS